MLPEHLPSAQKTADVTLLPLGPPPDGQSAATISICLINSVPIFGVFIWPPANFLIIAAALIILLYSRGIDQK